jgi:sulfite exporter TauE/SafE
MKALLVRFSEPSSYAGLGAIVGVLGLHVPDGTLQAASMILAGICGLVAIFLPETKPAA